MLARKPLHIALVLALGSVVYSNTLDAPFYLDDYMNIVDNPNIKSVSLVPSMFTRIEGPLASRPLALATLALNYALSGLDTAPYHLFNLLLHLLNGALLYLLISETASYTGLPDDRARPAALMASLLFVLHPVQTESVTYVVSRSMLLCTTFYLLGVLLFSRASRASRSRGATALYTLGLIVVALAGASSREDFVTFPLVLAMYDYVFLSAGDVKGPFKRWRYHLPGVLALAYLAFLVASYRYMGAGFNVKSITPAEYLATQFRVHFTHLRLLALPVNQNLDYDYPLSEVSISFQTLAYLAGYLALWCAVMFLAGKNRPFSFCAIWFLITLLPSSSAVPLVDMIFEHRLYLPSIGVFALLSYSAFHVLKARRSVLIAVFVSAIAAMSVLAFARNQLWADDRALWEDTVKKSPYKARPRNNLGVVYERREMFKEAEEQYRTAVAIDPFYIQARVNLGVFYTNRGRYEEAEQELIAATKAEGLSAGDTSLPFSPQAHYNLGVVYHKMGRLADAEREFRATLERDPGSADAHFNLGVVYHKMGRLADAEREFRYVTSINPAAPDAHNNLGVVYMDTGRLADAAREFEEAARLAPRFANAFFNLGVIYGKQGLYDKAEKAYRAALAANPGYADAHNNLGTLYVDMGLYDAAVNEFRAALEARPGHAVFEENLNRALKLRK